MREHYDIIIAVLAGVGISVATSYVRDAIKAGVSIAGRKLKIFGVNVVVPAVARIIVEGNQRLRKAELGDDAFKARMVATAVYQYLDGIWCCCLAVGLGASASFLIRTLIWGGVAAFVASGFLMIVGGTRMVWGNALFRAANREVETMVGPTLPISGKSSDGK